MSRPCTARFALILALSFGTYCAPAAEPGVHASADAVQPLLPGSSVPSAQVRSVSGEAVDLATRVAEQGALLVFYRGGW